MDNGNKSLVKHKAIYLLWNFFSSSDSYVIDLTTHEISVLIAIARYLDMPNKRCSLKRKTLAHNAHISIRQLDRVEPRLMKFKLIERTKSGKKDTFNYQLGVYFSCDKTIEELAT